MGTLTIIGTDYTETYDDRGVTVVHVEDIWPDKALERSVKANFGEPVWAHDGDGEMAIYPRGYQAAVRRATSAPSGKPMRMTADEAMRRILIMQGAQDKEFGT